MTGSEIHLTEIIGDNEGLSVTGLAKLLGVTKGAVSQNLKKLEKKGLTTKEEDPENLSRSTVRLTSKGKAAYYAHRNWHETMDGGYKSFYDKMKDEQIIFLLEYLTIVEDFLGRIMNNGK